jgi:phospho-N-acetylmuramoyl-pentapeptide-transferase
MLADFLLLFENTFSFLNVFRYLTFRSGMAAVTAFVFVLAAGGPFIRYIRSRQFGQAVRDDGPQSHLKKKGTPTLGGLLIIAGLSIGTLLWANLDNAYVWWLLFITWVFGAIGTLDDFIKIVKKDPNGLASRWKFRGLVFGALLASIGIWKAQTGWVGQGELYFPFFKTLSVDIGAWYMALSVLVIVGTANAVNFTDGLDGLAIGPSILNAAAFFILVYLGGNAIFANYLAIPHVPGISEAAVFCAAIVGAGVAFLWFNTYPAQIFMGDVGALALGGAIGALAVATKNEFLLVILGGVFVVETLSVVVQVVSFKLTGKRVFKMAPIHHHFELLGWPEPKVIVRFWIVSFVLTLLALATLKLR